MITLSRLKELLHYCQETGLFVRLVSTSSNAKVGDVAGRKHSRGYWHIGIDGKDYLAHRLAWLYMTGAWPTNQIDHINGVRDDNRISNLRGATNAENQQNTALRDDNTSGFMGVSWFRERGKWHARITIAGKDKHLGYFDTPEDAHEAYLTAKAAHHRFQPVMRAG